VRVVGHASSLDVYEMLTTFNFMKRRKISIYLCEFPEEHSEEICVKSSCRTPTEKGHNERNCILLRSMYGRRGITLK